MAGPTCPRSMLRIVRRAFTAHVPEWWTQGKENAAAACLAIGIPQNWTQCTVMGRDHRSKRGM